MTFEDILDQAIALLQRRGRITYRTLKLQFQLDEEQLETLKEELIEGQRVAVDEGSKVLVWRGAAAAQETERQNIGAEEPGPAPSDANSETDTPRAPRVDTAERRQLTVMFCDLVGSTALSTQLDPEELREVIRAYRETCAAAISEFGGYLAKYIGDGLLVYFGYPQAHEDDAQRAVRTALGIVEAIQQLSFPIIQLPRSLQVRIGIHTGLVVAGEMGVGDQPEPLAIVGETPNIAARLQEQAQPNSVVISPTTYRLTTGLFHCEELGLRVLKGLSTPLALYQVVRESAVQSRFEAAVQTGLTPLVGRTEELELLRRRWEQAKQGAGQVVLLSGEPGVGKSRLVQELKEHVNAEGTPCIEFRCSSYHQNSALYPIIEHLQRLLQFARDDTSAAKLEKLQQRLSHYRFPQAETVPLLTALLSLPHPEDSPALTLSPQKQKEKAQAALVAWLVEEAERQPVSTIWEDLHWADPSTLEVLTLFVDQVPTTRFLALLTFRPEFIPPWGNRSHLSQITLGRLGRSEVEMMAQRVTGGKALPAEVLQQIVAKTDGVPLFVEELTKTVVESGLLSAVNDHYELSGPLPPLAIPTTLQDSLMARLDRLATVKEIAQLGAALGREFSYELLHAVSPLDEATLQRGLKQLVEAELVYQRGLLPQVQYLFKHALIQDIAYQSMLKSTRQQYHRRIAQVLEGQFPEIRKTQPELVAHHYTRSGQMEKAVEYLHLAGQQAVQRSAHVEAIHQLTAALELLTALPDTRARTQRELALHLALGLPLQVTRGVSSPDVLTTLTRARELCQQLGETRRLFPILSGLLLFHHVRGELPAARELGEQLLSLAQREQEPALLMEAHCALGSSLFPPGEFSAAHAHLVQGLTLYDAQHRYAPEFFYGGLEPGVFGLAEAARVLWYLGYPDRALEKSQAARTLAQERSHPFSVAVAQGFAAMVHQLRRESTLTHKWAEAVVTLAREQGFPVWLGQGAVLQGWALAERGQLDEGMRQMRHGLATRQAVGAKLSQSYNVALLAEAYGRAGQAEEGLATLAEALTVVDNTGERFYEAELYRLKGELTLQSPVANSKPQIEKEAEECFHKAIEVAQHQQAKSLELRAATSLAHLWRQQGKKTHARQMLSEIYGWFTEGFDTKDLQEAKALLEELS